MNDPTGDFARIRELLDERAFASFPVDGEVVVGDGGTFACHASAVLSPGVLDLFEVPDHVVALLRDCDPVRWAIEGRIISDCANGAILTANARDEIRSITDEFLMADVVDDAELPAAVRTPSGALVGVFALPGDGTYDVATGYDAEGKPCGFLVYTT